MFISTDKAV
ncbi:hypothetical protein YPPY58_3211, partial [Yersinia pestis PY-58]